MKKLLSILLALTMLLSLVACGNDGDSKDDNYENVIEEAMNALIKGDEDKLAKMYANMIHEGYAESEAENHVDSFESIITDYGELKSWEIIDCHEYDAKELADLIQKNKDAIEDLKEELDDGYIDEDDIENSGYNIDFKPSKIRGCVKTEIEIVVENDDGHESTKTIQFALIKEVNTWKIVDISYDWFLFFRF